MVLLLKVKVLFLKRHTYRRRINKINSKTEIIDLSNIYKVDNFTELLKLDLNQFHLRERKDVIKAQDAKEKTVGSFTHKKMDIYGIDAITKIIAVEKIVDSLILMT